MNRGISFGGGSVIALALVIAVAYIWPREPKPYTITIKDPSIKQVSCHLTHGLVHRFYYPSRFRWEWGQLCRRAGFGDNLSRVYTRVPPNDQPADILWLNLGHEKLNQPGEFRLVMVNAVGRRQVSKLVPTVRDVKRRLTVFNLRFDLGLENHRGETLRIEDPKHGVELVSIEIK